MSAAWGEILSIWDRLGIERTNDQSAIRKAYARALKSIDPESDAAAFIALREARDMAMREAQSMGTDGTKAPEAFASAAVAMPTPSGMDAPPEIPDANPPPSPVDTFGTAFRTEAIAPDDMAMQRLHQLVFDQSLPHDADAIAQLGQELLNHPSMMRIDIAAGMEGWFAELIAHGTPRSDPLLDMAITYFRWNATSADLYRPPIIDWVVKRREDLTFETNLPDLDKGYAGLLAQLRAGIPQLQPTLTAWRYGPRMEYLMAYLNTLHPTVLTGIDQETLRWWEQRFGKQRAAMPPLNWLREGWRRMVWHRGLTGPYRSPSPFLIFAILFWPYICVWWLLREGYSRRARILGFGFAGLYLVTAALIGILPSDMFERRPSAMSEITQPVTTARFENFDDDMVPVLQMATGGTVAIDALLPENRRLYDRLKGLWIEERHRGHSYDAFVATAYRSIQDHYHEMLVEKGSEHIIPFAKSYANSLRWALRGGGKACVDYLEGRVPDPAPSKARELRKKLVGKALKRRPRPSVRTSKTFSIPASIFEEALRQSRLDRAMFKQALMGKGADDVRCTTQIVLIETAATAGDSEAILMLQNIFG